MINSVEIITEYSKNHTLRETLDYFVGGDGNDLIEWAYSVMPKKVAEIWESANKETSAQEVTKVNPEANQEKEGRKPITLKMYADNGKAVYEYDGLNEDGQRVVCKGEFKTREFAVKLAKRTAERCNQFKKRLVFEHGREIDGPVTMEGSPIGDFCLSKDAYNEVHKQLQKASYQSEWGGFTRNWNFS